MSGDQLFVALTQGRVLNVVVAAEEFGQACRAPRGSLERLRAQLAEQALRARATEFGYRGQGEAEQHERVACLAGSAGPHFTRRDALMVEGQVAELGAQGEIELGAAQGVWALRAQVSLPDQNERFARAERSQPDAARSVRHIGRDRR